jgi:hypothetical protein
MSQSMAIEKPQIPGQFSKKDVKSAFAAFDLDDNKYRWMSFLVFAPPFFFALS